jgi:hypothetical protein
MEEKVKLGHLAKLGENLEERVSAMMMMSKNPHP